MGRAFHQLGGEAVHNTVYNKDDQLIECSEICLICVLVYLNLERKHLSTKVQPPACHLLIAKQISSAEILLT